MALQLGCGSPGGLTHVCSSCRHLVGSWLKSVPPSLPNDQKGMVSLPPPPHICQKIQCSPVVTLPWARQYPLRQVPADLDDPGQPRGVYMCTPTFLPLVYVIGRVTCHAAVTHHSSWAEIQVLPIPEEHRTVLERVCQEAERLREL